MFPLLSPCQPWAFKLPIVKPTGLLFLLQGKGCGSVSHFSALRALPQIHPCSLGALKHTPKVHVSLVSDVSTSASLGQGSHCRRIQIPSYFSLHFQKSIFAFFYERFYITSHFLIFTMLCWFPAIQQSRSTIIIHTSLPS